MLEIHPFWVRGPVHLSSPSSDVIVSRPACPLVPCLILGWELITTNKTSPVPVEASENIISVGRTLEVFQVPPMPQPSFPPELHDKIVDMMDEDDFESLRHISAASKVFVPRARPILFRHIRILSFKSILQLASLLDSSFCTIPTTAKSLEIQFERPSPGKKLGPPTFTSEDVTTAIATMFEHFQSFEVTISLNLPWTFSRYLDWYYINPYTSLRKLVAAGTFIWLSDFTQFLHHVPTLECLIIDASFKCDSSPPVTVGIGRTVEACRVPSRLKEAGRPDSLHILRVKIDSVQAHIRTFYHLIPFLKMYGRELAHLYVWFEEIGTISHDDVSVFEGMPLIQDPICTH
ncbi:hypothetical protein FA13DRAFT_1708651 [Coprinellus micaceus]|uniref:F-box domain-containing protein n=1 Tax=Coprinellus micaceus TaxID=71717 RepID=A0A4Y7TGL1_COPMI|nr:hypothetical protein FA13DRAFT_1708651 [Coprinellus micaceus]